MMTCLVTNKIAIGTTKLGLKYGAIEQQKVPDTQAIDMLKLCRLKGFDMFDTAPSYGNAQTLLGQSIVNGDANIVTKTMSLTSIADVGQATVSAIETVHAAFIASLREMNVQSVYGLLIHNPADLAGDNVQNGNANALVDLLLSYKSSGLVKRIGVSVYKPEEARRFFEQFDFDLIQLPCNVFDQRFIETGTIDWLKQKGIEVHARSLFLKGILLKPEIQEGIPQVLIDKNAEFQSYLEERQMTSYEACLQFAGSHQDIDRWVIGVSKEQQITQLLMAAKRNRKDDKESDLLDFSSWSLGDSTALDPRYW